MPPRRRPTESRAPAPKKVASKGNPDAKPKKPRPKGWGPSLVLQWLEWNPAGSISGLINRLVKDTPGVTAPSLLRDIQNWRRDDKEFSASYKTLSESRRKSSPKQDLEMIPGLEDWSVQWALAYLEHRSFGEACRVVGVPINRVQNLTLRTSATHDPKLADLREQVERVILTVAEDAVWEALEIARLNQDSRNMSWIGLSILERLDKQRWSRQTNIEHSGTIQHQHEITVRKQQAAMDRAQQISAVLAPHMVDQEKTRRELPEGTPTLVLQDIVDAEYVEVE